MSQESQECPQDGPQPGWAVHLNLELGVHGQGSPSGCKSQSIKSFINKHPWSTDLQGCAPSGVT